MREAVTADRIRLLMKRLGSAAKESVRIYVTGGATAILQGWRSSTVDVDLKMVPERDELFRAIPGLKEELHVNIELASPPDFIPALPGWEDRSLFIAREGRAEWFHFDPYSQALAKIERWHPRDLEDVERLIRSGFVEPARLREFFEAIKPQLIRYPAIDQASFARRVEEVVRRFGGA